MRLTAAGIVATTALTLIALAAPLASASADAEQRAVNVYSHRHYESDRRLYDIFEEQTGIRVNVRFGVLVFEGLYIENVVLGHGYSHAWQDDIAKRSGLRQQVLGEKVRVREWAVF